MTAFGLRVGEGVWRCTGRRLSRGGLTGVRAHGVGEVLAPACGPSGVRPKRVGPKKNQKKEDGPPTNPTRFPLVSLASPSLPSLRLKSKPQTPTRSAPPRSLTPPAAANAAVLHERRRWRAGRRWTMCLRWC